MNEDFNNLVSLFKNMSTQEKKDALIKEFKINLAAIERINKDIGLNNELLLNKEILDVDKENATDDDYLEAYFVYLNMIGDSMLSFAEKVSNDFFETDSN